MLHTLFASLNSKTHSSQTTINDFVDEKLERMNGKKCQRYTSHLDMENHIIIDNDKSQANYHSSHQLPHNYTSFNCLLFNVVELDDDDISDSFQLQKKMYYFIIVILLIYGHDNIICWFICMTRTA